MKIGILGDLGRAGSRHARNAEVLGHEVLGYDTARPSVLSWPAVIDWAEAMVIATPSPRHLHDLQACLNAGKPVLCEKPLGMVGQADKIAKLDLDRIAVGFNLRFHPGLTHLRGIERPYYAQFVCCQRTEQDAVLANGVLNDWLCHELDLAIHLIGRLRLIDFHADQLRADLMLRSWTSGCLVHIHSDMLARQFVRRAMVVGENVGSELDLQNLSPVTDLHYRDELAAFVRFAEGEEPELLASGWDGLEVLRLCERIAGLNVHYDGRAAE